MLLIQYTRSNTDGNRHPRWIRKTPEQVKRTHIAIDILTSVEVHCLPVYLFVCVFLRERREREKCNIGSLCWICQVSFFVATDHVCQVFVLFGLPWFDFVYLVFVFPSSCHRSVLSSCQHITNSMNIPLSEFSHRLFRRHRLLLLLLQNLYIYMYTFLQPLLSPTSLVYGCKYH